MFQRRKGVPARFHQRVPAHKGVPARGSSRGSSTFVSPLFPCISAQMPLLAPLVDRANPDRAAVGTRGYAGPDGLGCTDLPAHPDTKVAICPVTTIARIRIRTCIRVQQRSRGPWLSSCSSLVKPRGTKFWSSMW